MHASVEFAQLAFESGSEAGLACFGEVLPGMRVISDAPSSQNAFFGAHLRGLGKVRRVVGCSVGLRTPWPAIVWHETNTGEEPFDNLRQGLVP